MLAELGHFSLALAFLMAVALAIYPMWGVQRASQTMMALARPLATGMFLFTAIAYGALTWAFVSNDFTLSYVASNSNSALPVYYRVTAVWGGHEGSFLLWVFVLSCWTVAVARFSRAMPQPMVARVLAILGLIAASFYLYVLTASNPFERLLPFYPVDGRDLNPLLQDIGMIMHPPMLYMGYVGFSVVFALAIAALINGRLDAAWARWARPWTLAAWVFLTIGIMLGSWWAYYELGWGGWWFWDPVENASFMPWLAGTALLHSLAVTEKRKLFKSWTVLLAIAAFSLSLLGTFLVRSGVIVSVHAFASDPTRGLFILGILAVTIGGSLLLFALRAAGLRSLANYQPVSREVMLMGNNLFLSAATLVVLLGTLLPLVHKELGLGSISIGAPFFNQMFSYLIGPFVALLAIGPLSRWKNQSLLALRGQIITGLLIAAVGSLLINWQYSGIEAWALVGTLLALWIGVSTVQEIVSRHGDGPAGMQSLKRLTPSHWGMVLGHIGFAVTLMGIALTSHYSVEKDVRMAVGERTELAGYQFEFNGVTSLQGPNYRGQQALVDIYQDGEHIAHLRAEKRFYQVQRNMMTEAAIDGGFTRDLYVALGEQLSNGDWGLRLYVKPFVRWIWAGALLMALGGIMSMLDKRYRLAQAKTNAPVEQLQGQTV